MNSFAVAGLVTAIASLFVPFFGLTGTVGLVLSSLGRAEAKAHRSTKGKSVAGIVISIISIILALGENAVIVLYFLGKLPLTP